MDPVLLIARVLHIVLGVYWAGALIFNAFFLFPAMRDAGPDGAKVAAGLMRRGFMTLTPIAAALTIVSGVWLYATMVGFEPEFMRSGRGVTFGFGGIVAIIAFIIGMLVVRPSMLRAVSLSQSVATAPEAERAGMIETANALRLKGARGGQIVAILLTIATISMALGRYM